MKKLNIFVLSLALMSGAAFAQKSTLPSFSEGEDYAQVRVKMLKAGWKPHVQAGADVCGETDQRCKGRPEMEACAGTGEADCLFKWKKKNKVVSICTKGEEAKFSGFCD